LFPIPGNGRGTSNLTPNLALYVDDLILGHWQEGAGWTYIITNLTFVCSVMLGVFAGQILQSENKTLQESLAVDTDRGVLCFGGTLMGYMVPDNTSTSGQAHLYSMPEASALYSWLSFTL